MLHRQLAAALFLTSVALPASAATVNVAVGGAGLVFTPQTVNIQTGDTVVWTNAGGYHSVQADDGTSFSIAAAYPPWSLSHTFTAAGTFGFHCAIHGSPGAGMFGTVVVADAGGGGGGGGGGQPQPGTFGFSSASTTVNEGAGTATVTVQRTAGADGAVSVQYSTSSGTATAGQDYTPASGTLSWADQDSADKTFTVKVINDTLPEPSETVLLALSNPTGGATLDNARKNATLTILDNDGGGGGPLAAPTNLQAVVRSTSEIDLTWTDNSSSETGFSVERRTTASTYEVVATVGPNTTSAAVTGLDPGSFSLFRVRATGAGATFSPYSSEVATATFAVPGPCVAGPNSICVTNNRFKIDVAFRTSTANGLGFPVALPSAPASGLFYFFDPTNIEMLIKVLDACVPPYNHYWVYFAATTNVEFSTVVTDTQNGQTRAYFNPLNRMAVPVQDGNAFATCP